MVLKILIATVQQGVFELSKAVLTSKQSKKPQQSCLRSVRVRVSISWWSPCQYNSYAQASTKWLLRVLWVYQPPQWRFWWDFLAYTLKLCYVFTSDKVRIYLQIFRTYEVWSLAKVWGKVYQQFKHWSLPQVDFKTSRKVVQLTPLHKGINWILLDVQIPWRGLRTQQTLKPCAGTSHTIGWPEISEASWHLHMKKFI